LEDYFHTLEALHLLEPAKGTESELFALLEQQVLAFYDPLTHTYYEIDTPPSAEAAAIPPSLIAIHELTHALQDQRFAIGQRDRELRDDWDAGLAYHAVIEGEATLVMLAALTDGILPLDVLVENDLLRTKMAEAAQSDLLAVADAPRYFVESLKFPYLAGLNFVMDAYKRGGWKAVDQLHQRPPRSTREVLHPEEYVSRMKEGTAEPAVVHTLPNGTRPFLDQQLGEFHWAFLLGEESTRGLRADRVSVIHDAFCQPTVLVETRWDTESQAEAFRSRYERFLVDREKLVEVVRRGKVVRAAYGADAVLAERFLR
ncbi:MAG TPA: hypothetical protein VFL80_01160, partial [Thermoanaerobaculia bacterium]|nr:hypothetical protein [Thermoanaerobaculia bacterium]